MLKLKRLNSQRIIFGMAMIAAIALLFISAFSLSNSFQKRNSTFAESTGFKNMTILSGTYSTRQEFKNTYVYKVTGNTTLSKGALVSGGTAVLYIPAGFTVTATGDVGMAGIGVASDRCLIIVGEGTLIATGGSAANGTNGVSGNNGTLSISGGYFRGGYGGLGGAGGRGGGAGIGGNGGAGGTGGYGGTCAQADCEHGSSYEMEGTPGKNGKDGYDGGSMGTLYVYGGMTVTATGGVAAASGGSGGSAGTGANDSGSGWWYGYTAGGGGGGGGGAGGSRGEGIGSGGPGGGGGGGGSAGGTFTIAHGKPFYYMGGAGGGYGKGYANGSNGGTATFDSYCTDWYSQPSGGAGGSAGSYGNNGSLYSDAAAVSGVRATYTNGKLSETNYIVSFDNQSATISGTVNNSVYLGLYMDKITPPKRDGYIFQGYYSGTNGSGTKYYNYDGSAVRRWDLTLDTTLYAKWTSISLNKQSGTGGTDSISPVYGSAMPTITPPKRSGYMFYGYYTGTNGTGTKYYNYNGTSAKTCYLTSATTLYAYWIPVTLNKQSGSGGTTSISPTYNSAMPTITPPSRTGYNFQGYFTGTGGTGTKYYNADGTSATNCYITSSTTLYAHWLGIKYNVLFHSNYGVDSTSSQGPFTYGAAQTLRANTFLRTGYNFQGWATSASSKTVSYGNQANVSTLTTADGNTVDLYAVWKANTYTVALNNQSATTAGTASVTATYDSSMPGITLPKRTGYTFQGYYSEIDGAGTKYYNADGISARTWNVDEDTTLYAYWKINQYELNLNPNGGRIGDNSENEVRVLDYGAAYGTLPMPTRDGFIFKGWYNETTGEDAFASTRMIDANVKIFAQWEETWTNDSIGVTFGTLTGDAEKDEKIITGSGNDIRDPYIIRNTKQLAYLALKSSKGETTFAGKYFKQMDNIDILEKTWLPIGNETTPFEGHYDGNGYLITNIKTLTEGNIQYSNVGLFGYTKNATLQNINIISGNVTGNNNVGSIVGYMNNGLLSGCRSGAFVNGNESCGLIGRGNSVRIISCYNYGDIIGGKNVGGILGLFEGSLTKDGAGKTLSIIENCYSKCNVQASSGYAGGILGYSNVSGSEIKASGFDGYVSGIGANINSISGYMSNGKITDCFANSNVASYYSGSATVNAFIYTIKNSTTQKYIGSDFSSWSVTASGTPLPAGFSWLGKGGTKLSIEILKELGYSA